MNSKSFEWDDCDAPGSTTTGITYIHNLKTTSTLKVSRETTGINNQKNITSSAATNSIEEQERFNQEDGEEDVSYQTAPPTRANKETETCSDCGSITTGVNNQKDITSLIATISIEERDWYDDRFNQEEEEDEKSHHNASPNIATEKHPYRGAIKEIYDTCSDCFTFSKINTKILMWILIIIISTICIGLFTMLIIFV